MDTQQPPAPYTADYDWLWTPTTSQTRTLRITISHTNPDVLRQAITNYVRALPRDDNGIVGRGGWALYPNLTKSEPTAVVVDLVSGGEDVADGIIDGADDIYTHFHTIAGIKIQWRQLEN